MKGYQVGIRDQARIPSSYVCNGLICQGEPSNHYDRAGAWKAGL
jgi:hypothetical protein